MGERKTQKLCASHPYRACAPVRVFSAAASLLRHALPPRPPRRAGPATPLPGWASPLPTALTVPQISPTPHNNRICIIGLAVLAAVPVSRALRGELRGREREAGLSTSSSIPTHPTLTRSTLFPSLQNIQGRRGPATPLTGQVTFLIVAYSMCSSMLLILNKVAVTAVPAPAFILLAQVASSAAFVKGLAAGGVVSCEPLEPAKARAFALIVFGFIGTLFANVSALKHVPVDTIICFRASTPLVIAVIEYLHLGRELPSARSWAALGGVFAGVTAYAATDVHFTPRGYFWLGVWYCFAVAEMVWVKQVVDGVAMSTWSRSFYQNALAIGPMALITLLNGELGTALSGNAGAGGWAAVAASCVAGLGMSYFSFALRAAISATSFSVIGNICKVLTILVNAAMWDQHAGPAGTAALLVCLAAGALYRQPPLRAGYVPGAAATAAAAVAGGGGGAAARKAGGFALPGMGGSLDVGGKIGVGGRGGGGGGVGVVAATV
jgi:solute carrier family 35